MPGYGPVVEMANTKWARDKDPPNKSCTGWRRQVGMLQCGECGNRHKFSHSTKVGGLRIMQCDNCGFLSILDCRKKGKIDWIQVPPVDG